MSKGRGEDHKGTDARPAGRWRQEGQSLIVATEAPHLGKGSRCLGESGFNMK